MILEILRSSQKYTVEKFGGSTVNELVRLMQSAGYAFEGLACLLREEKNTRLLLIITLLALIICPLFGFTAFQTIIVFFALMVTVAAEVLNTAIEAALNYVTEGRYHPKVKLAKDVAAASVLLCVVNSIVVFFVILFSNLFGH